MDEETKQAEHWTIGEWKPGYTQYCCKYCPFDSLEEEDIVEHYRRRHAPPPEPAPQAFIPIFDRFGNQIN